MIPMCGEQVEQRRQRFYQAVRDSLWRVRHRRHAVSEIVTSGSEKHNPFSKRVLLQFLVTDFAAGEGPHDLAAFFAALRFAGQLEFSPGTVNHRSILAQASQKKRGSKNKHRGPQDRDSMY